MPDQKLLPLHIRSEGAGFAIEAVYGPLSNQLLSHWTIGDEGLAESALYELRGLMRTLRQIRILLLDENQQTGNVPQFTIAQGSSLMWLQRGVYRWMLPPVFNDASEIEGILNVLVTVEVKIDEILAQHEVRHLEFAFA